MPLRELTQTEEERLKELSSEAIDFALLNPTRTAFSKSIMDATEPVREFLASNKIHDFAVQGRGAASNGVRLPASYYGSDEDVGVTVSLYRPEAKPERGGDPRIWIYRLGDLASPGDILALLSDDGKLAVINVTRADLISALAPGKSGPLKQLVQRAAARSSATAMELLGKLRGLAAGGWLPSVMDERQDTAIGRTIEHFLGIPMNPAKEPDYKGIELKSARIRKNPNRHQLFSRVPKWKISKFKSMGEVLSHFGHGAGSHRHLNCTVRSTGFNPDRLRLAVEQQETILGEYTDKPGIGTFARWHIADLKDALTTKHDETFWIKAVSHELKGREHFELVEAVHTRKPLASQFAALVEVGAITLDHQIKVVESGAVKERGPSFKLNPSSFELLFPPNRTYQLA
ncbi:MvaI/BcnI family restriction endonuclease [Qipengyuania sp. CAU 1752]